MTDAPAAPAADANNEPATPPANQPAASSSQPNGSAPAANGGTPPANGSIAAGGEPAKAPDQKPYWPEDWRVKAAEHIAAGDKKAYARELKRLERVADPAGLYGMYREAESKLTEGGLIKKPGKNATPEDVAAYRQALGVPEKPEAYVESMKLENGATLGNEDKQMATGFAKIMHEAGATPDVFNKAINWYFEQQAETAAAMEQRDDEYRTESMQALKEEYGASFQRNLNGLSALFSMAPGGADPKNPESLFARLLGGRTADGKRIGDDPAFVKFAIALAHEIAPAATVTEDGDQSGDKMNAEIAAIEKRMREDNAGYFKDEKMQARYRDLVAAREKHVARQRT